jgi:hypothetical protein
MLGMQLLRAGPAKRSWPALLQYFHTPQAGVAAHPGLRVYLARGSFWNIVGFGVGHAVPLFLVGSSALCSDVFSSIDPM